MIKTLKWIAITLGAVVVILALTGFTLVLRGRTKAAQAPSIAAPAPPAITADSAAIRRGAHIVNAVTACAGCHGTGLEGKMFDTPPMLVSMAAPNLTAGQGGVGAGADVAYWDRAIRRGIGKDGRSLMIMPSQAYAHMSEADFAAVVAYLQTLAPADNPLPARKVGLLGGALIGAGQFPLAAHTIAEQKTQPAQVQPAASAAYGEYLVTIAACSDCHGPDLNGQAAHGMKAPSLRTHVRGWSDEEFRTALRSGKTPDGRSLDGQLMPWPFYANMTDDELAAIALHLRSLPAPASQAAP